MNIIFCIVIVTMVEIFLFPLTSLRAHTYSFSKEYVIYHGFDQSFTEIINVLPQLSDLGISHIQLSPVNSSRNSLPKKAINLELHRKCFKSSYFSNQSEKRCPAQYLKEIHHKETVLWYELFEQDGSPVFKKKPWYLHYQPSSYEIEDSYGSEAELRELVRCAEKMDPPIQLIADIVLSHLRGPDELEKEDWLAYEKSQDPQVEKKCKVDDPIYTCIHPHVEHLLGLKFNINELGEFIYPWSGSGHSEGCWPCSTLPTLKVLQPLIREKQNAYIKHLLEIGISGFRFDVARILPIEVFYDVRNIAKGLNKEIFLYGEVIENDRTVLKKWQNERNGLAVTAYNLFDYLKAYFSKTESLLWAHGLHDLIESNDITFIASHDTINGGLNQYYQMLDAHSPMDISAEGVLAQSFLIGSSIGIPLLLPDLIKKERVQAALLFRKKTGKIAVPIPIDSFDPVDNTYLQDYVLVIQRCGIGFMAINKHADKAIPWPIILERNVDLIGHFQEINHHEEHVYIQRINNKPSITSNACLPPKSVRFFIQMDRK